MELPSQLPDHLPTALGPMPVTVEPGMIENEDLFGLTRFTERDIRLAEGMTPTTAWQTFWHEATHVMLQDSGATKLLKDKTEEAICNAVGTFLTAAMAQGFISIPSLDSARLAVKSGGKGDAHEPGPDHREGQ